MDAGLRSSVQVNASVPTLTSINSTDVGSNCQVQALAQHLHIDVSSIRICTGTRQCGWDESARNVHKSALCWERFFWWTLEALTTPTHTSPVVEVAEGYLFT